MRLSPKSCEQHQAASPERCKGCERFVSDLEVKRQLYIVRKKGAQVANHQVAECKGCKRVMPLPGRGLCGKCYSRALKDEKGRAVKKKPAVSQPADHDDTGEGKTVVTESVAAPEKQAPCIMEPSKPPTGIDWLFAGEEALLEKVQVLAKKDRRDVRCEVLCIVEEYLEGVG